MYCLKTSLFKPLVRGLTLLVLGSAVVGGAQGLPAAVDTMGLVAGSLHYDLNYSQSFQVSGSAAGNAQRANLSGDVGYANGSPRKPFSLTYSGGDSWTLGGNNTGSGYFQHLTVNQGLVRPNWSIKASDDMAFSPASPQGGYSGVPGTGGPSSGTTVPTEQILTYGGRSISNATSLGYSRRLDYADSMSVTGAYDIVRFPDGIGQETNTLMASAGVSRRFGPRNSLTVNGNYMRYSYPGVTEIILGEGLMVGGQRSWSRNFRTSASIGPQWVQATPIWVLDSGPKDSQSASPDRKPPPNRYHLEQVSLEALSVSASASYQWRKSTLSLAYSQGSTAGSGALDTTGSLVRDLVLAYSHPIGRKGSFSANMTYMRSQVLSSAQSTATAGATGSTTGNGITTGKMENLSYSRPLAPTLNFFITYSAAQQSSSAALGTNAILGSTQTAAFGLSYSPRAVRLTK